MAVLTPARADVKDYEFQLVSQEVKKGDAVIAVKLVHKPSGRAIPDAVIFAKRIDMGPDGMGDMQAKLDPIAPRGSNHGIRNAGIAAGRIDQNLIAGEQPGTFTLQDHIQGGPVFH